VLLLWSLDSTIQPAAATIELRTMNTMNTLRSKGRDVRSKMMNAPPVE
jgi:hypothetical protein